MSSYRLARTRDLDRQLPMTVVTPSTVSVSVMSQKSSLRT